MCQNRHRRYRGRCLCMWVWKMWWNLGMWRWGTVELQLRQGFTDVRDFTVVRTSSDVRPFPVVRSLGENRARGEELQKIPGKKKMVRSKLSGLVDGKRWGGLEKLDPHTATQIHGPNPTKSQLTNKSQKKFGAIFGGEFSELGRKQQNQARKHGVGAPKT